MDKVHQRVKEFEQHQALRRDVDQIAQELLGLVDRNSALAQSRAQALWGQAREAWKRDCHFDPRGWIRPLKKARELMRLDAEVQEFLVRPLGKKMTKRERKQNERYEALCDELGVSNLPGIEEHAEVLRRSEEHARKAKPRQQNEQLPESVRRLMATRGQWDSDYYIWTQIQDVVHGDRSLAAASEGAAMDVVLALLLVLDRGRTFLERVGSWADVPDGDVQIGERSRWQLEFVPMHPPIRGWALHYHKYDPARTTFEEAHVVLGRIDSSMLSLGRCAVDLFPAPGWEYWCLKAMDLLDTAPKGLMPSELQRLLAGDGFQGSQKSREKLSAILRGEKPWPGLAKKVALARSHNRRLLARERWRDTLTNEVGIRRPPAGPRSPF